jgi:hypothetical protein
MRAKQISAVSILFFLIAQKSKQPSVTDIEFRPAAGMRPAFVRSLAASRRRSLLTPRVSGCACRMQMDDADEQNDLYQDTEAHEEADGGIMAFFADAPLFAEAGSPPAASPAPRAFPPAPAAPAPGLTRGTNDTGERRTERHTSSGLSGNPIHYLYRRLWEEKIMATCTAGTVIAWNVCLFVRIAERTVSVDVS